MNNQATTLDFRTKFAFWSADLGTALLRLLPPEFSHELAMGMMRRGALRWLPKPLSWDSPVELKTKVKGIGDLRHPIGLAAGFDKNCLCVDALRELGFSFLEVGTITPKPQGGNPKPRLFRYKDQMALINRMGFNNDGIIEVFRRIDSLHWDHAHSPLGINIGKNKNTPVDGAIDDYLEGFEAFEQLSGYMVVNISSPNTPGLRDLASKPFIESMARGMSRGLDRCWVKLDPDMPKKQFQDVVAAIVDAGFAGVILTNTHLVRSPTQGGQSGHPLAIASTRCLEWAWEVHKGGVPMIGSGGILSGGDIVEKLIRGASAVQIYSAFVYRGPWAVSKLLRELADELELRGLGSVDEAIGAMYH